MNEQTTFDLKLETLFQAYADRAPLDVDATAVAATIARRQGRGRWAILPARRSWLMPALVGLLLLVALAAAAFVGAQLLREVAPPRPYSEVMVPAGKLTMPRFDPIVVTLADGRVLVAGGDDGTPGGIPAEVFDPETGESVRVSDAPVGFGEGVSLEDGRVLVIAYSQNMTSSVAHVFDPASMTFRRLEQEGFSNAPPFGVTPSMALLRDGRVLVSGGKRDVYRIEVSRSAVVFDPATDIFTPVGEMLEPRIGHAMVTLDDGRVVILGGYSSPGSSAERIEVFDPSTGLFLSGPELTDRLSTVGAVALPDGSVLAYTLGGPWTVDDFAPGSSPPRLVRFDPATDAVSVERLGGDWPMNASHLRDGRVLFSGASLSEPNYVGPGLYYDLYEPWASVFDPITGLTTRTAAPRTQNPGSAVLLDGRVIFAGGFAYPPVDENGNGTGEGRTSDQVEVYE